MTVFPPDILSIAQSIVSAISSRMEASSTLGDAATEVIAEAIAAERKRCALIAENCNSFPFEGDHIGTLIRSGEQP